MPLSRITTLLLLSLALAAGAAQASPRTWQVDPVHTRIVFAIDHAGFSKSLGTFSGIEGVLAFDPDDPAATTIDVRIPVASLDFGDEKWNRASLAANLLDAGAHPVARFRSTRVEPVDAARAIVHGVLELRGVRREVQLEAVVNAVKRHPLPPFRRTAGFSATAVLSRSDFGMTAWSSMIGDRVELRIETEATLARGATPDSAPEDAVDADARPADAGPPAAAAEPDDTEPSPCR